MASVAKRGQTGGSLGGRVVNTRRRKPKTPVTKASEVVVRRPDGTTETQPAYDVKSARKVIEQGERTKRRKGQARG